MPDYRGLTIPFVDFGGGVTSDSLFDAKEAALFDFYAASKDRYAKALDIGANIGVHTIMMAKQGWEVSAFEPDPDHFKMLAENVAANRPYAKPVSMQEYAVSDRNGSATFVRVLGNTTGNHIAGDKRPYGELKEITVTTIPCQYGLFERADFAKIDCEGHEARLLLTVKPEDRCEFMVEVGNVINAGLIFAHMGQIKRRMWAQKNDWQEVRDFREMPQHHSEGALFIGRKPPFA